MLDELQRRRLKVIEAREEVIRQVFGELEAATQYDSGQIKYRMRMEDLLGEARELAISLDGRESDRINQTLRGITECYVGALQYLDEKFESDPEIEEVIMKLHAPMFTLIDMYLLGFGR